jgi:CheY-like chemotaxis protein
VRGPGRPPLLLADDDPMLLPAMAELLTAEGYAVSQVDSLKDAIELVEFRDFNVIVCDWRMHDGTGSDLFKWIQGHKPHLVERLVFLSENEQDDALAATPDRPVFRKGMDSQRFLDVLKEIVASVRGVF